MSQGEHIYFISRYSRKGGALAYLGRFDESIKTYEEGLKFDPSNTQLKEGLEEVRQQRDQSNANARNM